MQILRDEPERTYERVERRVGRHPSHLVDGLEWQDVLVVVRAPQGAAGTAAGAQVTWREGRWCTCAEANAQAASDSEPPGITKTVTVVEIMSTEGEEGEALQKHFGQWINARRVDFLYDHCKPLP